MKYVPSRLETKILIETHAPLQAALPYPLYFPASASQASSPQPSPGAGIRIRYHNWPHSHIEINLQPRSVCEPGHILHRVTLQRHLQQLRRHRVDEIPRHGSPLAVPAQREISGLERKLVQGGSVRVEVFEGLVHDLGVEIRENRGGGSDGEVGWSVDPVEVPVIFQGDPFAQRIWVCG